MFGHDCLLSVQANYHFHADYWGQISSGVQDLIRKMLTLDQKLRWSARQLLSHPWITAGDAELAGYDLSSSQAEMRKYNARRRLRAAANTVIMTNRIAKLTNFGSQNSKDNVSPEDSGNTNVDKRKVVPVGGTEVIEGETDQTCSDYKPPSC